ncbi:MAG: Mu transposase C-terminal domain-containing protein [Xanthomonadales bacterium]|nr:Mu transposase C-terminal domain-containing protein [Xanthomonadales bacterium]
MSAPDMVFSLAELADAIGITYEAVKKRAQRCGWPTVPLGGHGPSKGFMLSQLPEDIQEAITLRESAHEQAEAKRAAEAQTIAGADNEEQRNAIWQAYQSARGWQKRIASTRMDALVMLDRLRDEGLNLRQARAAVATHYAAQGVKGCSVAAMQRWQRTLRGLPRCDWMAYLLPLAKKPRASLVIHKDAWLVFRADYLRLEAPSAASCYRRLQQQAKANPEWGYLPSLKTFLGRIRRDVPRTQIVLRRQGDEALATIGPKIARSRSGIAPMERVNSDGHKFDVAVVWPDGSIGRPMIVGWQDIASSKMLAWRVGKSETSDLVRLSFCDMVREYGIPTHAYLDNGRAYASKKNTGGLATRYRYKVKEEDPEGVITRLGTEVHWVTPYNGKAKPIERLWRDFAQDIARRPEFAGAYLGNSPSTKPENYGSRAIPFDEFMRVLNEGIAEHNAREGRRGGVCEGRSFDTTFAGGYAAATIKRATEHQLSLLLLASELAKVDARSGEVRLAGNRYWAECIVPYIGQRIELRFDPEVLQATIHAVTLQGEYIGAVPCIAALGWETSDQMREGIKSQRDWKRAHKAERAAALRVETAHGARGAPATVPGATPRPAATALLVPKRIPVHQRRAPDSTQVGYSAALVDYVFKKQGIKL